MIAQTREEALLDCFDLWLWIAVTNGHKFEWPGWKTNGGYLELCTSFCPACEFSTECDCIIKWGSCGGHCNSSGSPFYYWHNGRPSKKDRKKYALQIATLALKALFGEK